MQLPPGCGWGGGSQLAARHVLGMAQAVHKQTLIYIYISTRKHKLLRAHNK